MSGDATPGQIGGFLMALRTKGETVDEIEGLARTMLEFANPVRPPVPAVDVVGTGGDRSGTFNISTVSAIVVAGAGVPVAKHGNRAASSHCGSADVLEALGVNIDLDAEGVERCLAQAGIGFLFAPRFHPAMAHAGPVRRELRVPTVFNFLGPLTNPARPYAQAVGCSDARMLPLMAEVLARRGTRATLFRGEDGLDELTTTGISTVFDVRDGEVRETHLDPAELNIVRATLADLAGGDARESAAIARALLAGAPGPKRDVVLLNAGAALEVAGVGGLARRGHGGRRRGDRYGRRRGHPRAVGRGVERVASRAMILSDRTIREEIAAGRIVIDPFDPACVQPSSVDLHVDSQFRVFANSRYPFIDVKQEMPDLTELVEVKPDEPFILHPGEFVLGSTLERVSVPNDLVARLEGKSSLGRLGLLIHSTAGYVDPGWDGYLTLELSNVANLPITLYPGMKIGQISFFRLTTEAETPYGSAGNKYQGQRGPTPSRFFRDFDDESVEVRADQQSPVQLGEIDVE